MALTDAARGRYAGADYDSDSDDEDDYRRQRIHSNDDRRYDGTNGGGSRGMAGGMVVDVSDDDSIEGDAMRGGPGDALMNNVRKFRQRLRNTTSTSSIGRTPSISFFFFFSSLTSHFTHPPLAT